MAGDDWWQCFSCSDWKAFLTGLISAFWFDDRSSYKTVGCEILEVRRPNGRLFLGCNTGHTMPDVDTRQVSPALFLESAVRNLSEWQRRHLPGIHSPPGKAVLAHLIETWSEQTSFTNLRKSTGFGETAIRHALNQFVALGIVEIHKDQFSRRQRGIAATPKLKERLEEYAALMRRVVDYHESR